MSLPAGIWFANEKKWEFSEPVETREVLGMEIEVYDNTAYQVTDRARELADRVRVFQQPAGDWWVVYSEA